MPPALTWEVAADPLKFEEAIAWFRARLPMSDADFYALDVAARRRAFGAAGIAQAHLAGGLHKVLTRAINEGTTLEEFKDSFEHNLEAAWGGPRPWQVENIFRTNLQLAYGAGRYKQLDSPAMRKVRPVWKYSSILDDRTSEICQPIAGTTLPADDAFWATHVPPLHFQCRSTIIALTEEEASESPEHIGLAPTAAEAQPPTKGFGRPPELGEWAPDPTPLPPPIRKIYEAKPSLPPPPPPPPKPVGPPPAHTPDHWLPTYQRFGDAAVPMAHARAALERGLDAKGADVHTAFGGIETPVAIRALLGVLDEHPLREQLERAKAQGSGAEHMIRAVAALYGHQQGLGAARVTAAEMQAQFTERNVPHAFQSQVASRTVILNEFKKQMLGFLSSRVQRHLRIQIRWTHARASYNVTPGPGRTLIDKRQIKLAADQRNANDHTLAHEFAHSLEASDPKRGKAAVAFLETRTQGELAKPLRRLIPGSGYRIAEVATPDKLRNPYAGKRYLGAGQPPWLWATEITSMGIQWLFGEPAKFLLEDEEHFLFTLGQLAGW